MHALDDVMLADAMEGSSAPGMAVEYSTAIMLTSVSLPKSVRAIVSVMVVTSGSGSGCDKVDCSTVPLAVADYSATAADKECSMSEPGSTFASSVFS